jgi:endogenous inhibitor of DNA gyrase (YacG/DUF329 family)
MPTLKCPACGRAFEKNESPALPFCSARCRQVDLGRWLGESYSLPIYRFDDEEPDEEQPSSRDDD